jgi:hypothetical protein
MKKMHILYGIVILAVVGILVYCASYTSGTVQVDTPQQSTYTAKSKQPLKKKSCACCDDKKRMREMMRQWLNEKPQENPSNKEVSATVADPERAQIVR